MAIKVTQPGVYIQELDAFPNSVVPVATAVPAFVGYTPKASYGGKSLLHKAQKINSFSEYQAMYMLPDNPDTGKPARQYLPQYYLLENDTKNDGTGDVDRNSYVHVNRKDYAILPDPNTIYYMHNSIRLFYENGGQEAYIVSVGNYGNASEQPLAINANQIINPNVSLNDLQAGIALLEKEQEPTLYICPDATLLSVNNNGTLMESMLLQAQDIKSAMCIFDVIGGRNPDAFNFSKDIETFRNHTGSLGLKFGASYYPFVGTTILQKIDIDFTNFFGGDIKKLAALINPTETPNPDAASIIEKIENPPPQNATPNSKLQAELIAASETYATIMEHVLAEANILPPSGGIAGIFTTNDNYKGVWDAPANVSMVGAASLPINLSDATQKDLNIDAVSGKSINPIRSFPGRGILVWGARTLDGNSNDWRYIPTRRTVTMIEQSTKLALQSYSFHSNDRNTWSEVKAMLENFLDNTWKAGGLQGNKATDAFEVNVGIGSTMKPEDLPNGIMRVSIRIAVAYPNEFIELTLVQKMQA